MQSLNEQLVSFKTEFLKNAPPENVKIMSDALTRLKASDVLNRALKNGDKAPLFNLMDATGQSVFLENRLSDGPVVLTFFRGVW